MFGIGYAVVQALFMAAACGFTVWMGKRIVGRMEEAEAKGMVMDVRIEGLRMFRIKGMFPCYCVIGGKEVELYGNYLPIAGRRLRVLYIAGEEWCAVEGDLKWTRRWWWFVWVGMAVMSLSWVVMELWLMGVLEF